MLAPITTATTHQFSCKPHDPIPGDVSEAATVPTTNCSTNSSMDSEDMYWPEHSISQPQDSPVQTKSTTATAWTCVGTRTDRRGALTVQAERTGHSKSLPLKRLARVSTRNYYNSFVNDDTSIAVDSGASDGFGDVDTPGTDRILVDRGVTMCSATGNCKKSIAEDKFDLPLPPEACHYHVLAKGDIKRPLLSVGKACDAGCNVWFDKNQCTFYKDGEELLTAIRDPVTSLYLLPRRAATTADIDAHRNYGHRNCTDRTTCDDINVRDRNCYATHTANSTTPIGLGLPRQAHNAYDIDSVPCLVQYLHACAGFPTHDTWIKAINRGYYLGWPGLTAARVRKFLPKSEITALGHLKQVRQGICSCTSKGEQRKDKPTDNPLTAEDVGLHRNVIACSVATTGIFGTDQTGRFPVTSIGGHKYIFILYDVDTGYIHAVPIKTRNAAELVRAYDEAYTTLTQCGFSPRLHRIDNETSKELVKAIRNKRLDYQTVPP